MWLKIRSYLTFLLNSTNQHGVHSPFIYSIVTQCFYKNTSKEKHYLFEKIQQTIFKNSAIIKGTDFKKKSNVFKNNHQKVKRIAKVTSISKNKALLLIRVTAYFHFNKILEIGTSVGLSASALSIANPKATITTLESCKNTAKVAQELFNKFNLNNVNITIGNFNNTLPPTINNKQFDLIYFNENHQKEATLNYFNSCLQCVTNDTVFIFNHIHWSKEMEIAWDEIKKHPKTTVTIDTFYWGFVFFRKEQKKQHFVIRV